MWKVRELADKVTNVVMNYTEIESKVREATNDEAWGPTGSIKHELSQATFSYDSFPEVMGMLWKRIAENKRSPRRIYKSLLLLHHLLLNGSDRVVRATQDRMYELRSLTEYRILEDPGFSLNTIIPPSGVENKDAELNVRVKAKDIVDLVQDEERLREDRKKAKKNRDKYVGIGSDRMLSSRWNDDYGGSSGGGGGGDNDFGDFDEMKSKKPYSDSDGDFNFKSNRSNHTTGNSYSFTNSSSTNSFKKPAPPTPPNEAEDDFDPRAGEAKTDFGDFTSASTSATVKSTVDKPIAAVKPAQNLTAFSPPKTEFADFQSAFGNSVEPEATSATTKSEPADDLLGLSFDIGTTSPNPMSFFGATSTFGGADTNLLMGSLSTGQAHAQPASFGGFSSGPASLPFPPNAGVGLNQMVQAPPPVQNHFMSSQSPMLTPILQPNQMHSSSTQPNSSASNNINNNAAPPNLKGTTWSDLNISADSLNLSRNTKSGSTTQKTTINQMLMNSPTKAGGAPNSLNNFGFP